ncbi:hypothetical protein VYU27_008631, partial [Nannochloropsis oceanica]
VLQAWHPSDSSAHLILSPWAPPVFDPRSFEALLLQSILPKLVAALRALPIVPQNQDLQPLEWCFAWSDILPPLHFLSLLEGELFPNWLQVLYSWLQSPTADFAEVADWFEGWKGVFPPQVINDTRIAHHFTLALEAMSQAMDPSLPPPSPAFPLTHISYMSVLEDRRRELVLHAAGPASNGMARDRTQSIAAGFMGDGTAAGIGGYGRHPTVVPPQHISFKDLVEIFCEKHGVLFLPKPGRTEHGRQVYSFGGVSVYMDNDVVFADLSNGGMSREARENERKEGMGYAPIALESLLQHVQSGGVRGGGGEGGGRR